MEFNQKYAGKWFKLTGDVNALEYGATYIRAIGKDSFEAIVFTGRDWDGYSDDRTYYATEYLATIDECIDAFGETKSYLGLDDDCPIASKIEAFIAYGKGHTGDVKDTSAKRLLGFNPDDRAYIPSDYIV